MQRLTWIFLLLALFATGTAWRHGRQSQPEQDHYKVLGVSSDATTAEIKRAFRKQAVQYHPDRTNNDPVAAEKFVKINEATQVLSDPAERRRFDQTRGGGGSGFAFHHGRTEFRRGRRRENVQTFHFGGREFRYEFRQDGFQRQHWGRSRQTEGFGSSIALSLVLASVLFVVYMYLLIDKALEQGDHGQDYDGQEEPFSRQPEDSESEGEHRGRRFRTNAAGKRKMEPKQKRFEVLRADTLALKGRFIVLAVVRDVPMSPMEQRVWGKVYAKLHAAANMFATDRCLLFRKLLARDAGTPARLGEQAADYVEQKVYEGWIQALMKDSITAKLDILESIRAEKEPKGGEGSERVLVTGRRLDALCVLRGSRMSSAVICCEQSVIGYYDALVKQDLLSTWLARLLDGTNMAKLSPIGLPSWPTLSSESSDVSFNEDSERKS